VEHVVLYLSAEIGKGGVLNIIPFWREISVFLCENSGLL